MNRFLKGALLILALGVLVLGGVTLSRHYRAENTAESQMAEVQIDTLTYEEIVPFMEQLVSRQAAPDTASGFAAYLCKDVRDLHDPREKIAYLAIMQFSQEGNGILLDPYVTADSFPKGLWEHPEVRQAMAPALEAAKKEYQGYEKSPG